MSQKARALSLQTVISKATTTDSLWTQPEAEGCPDNGESFVLVTPPEAPLYGSPRPWCTVFEYWCAYWWSTVATALKGRCSMGRCSRGT